MTCRRAADLFDHVGMYATSALLRDAAFELDRDVRDAVEIMEAEADAYGLDN